MQSLRREWGVMSAPRAGLIDPGLQLAFKRLDLDIKRQEYEAQLLLVWERELDMEGKRLRGSSEFKASASVGKILLSCSSLQ